MSNPFIEKAKRNPFIEKASTPKSNARRIAERNYRELQALLERFGPEDNPETVVRIRRRVEEARAAVESCR